MASLGDDSAVTQKSGPTLAEARQIAREAFVYGFPMVDNYRIEYSYFVDRGSPEYKAPYNQLVSTPRVFTPADKAIQTPNSDTPYGWMGYDLRAEPLVFTIPEIEKGRYWSTQFIDLYTHNFDYLGTRTTGNDGGNYLLAGPDWNGDTPPGIAKVLRSETSLGIICFRTQLFDPGDLDNVKAIQQRYIVQPSSAFLGKPAPEAPPPINFVKPLSPEEQRTSTKFFNLLNFTLQFAPTHPTEEQLRARLARIGLGPNMSFNVSNLSAEMREALSDGMAEGWADYEIVKSQIDAGKVTSGDVFGTRKHLKSNYAYRMAAALAGIYGNSKQEAMYPSYFVDSTGQKLNGSNRYELRFAPGQLPPAAAFWSLTMYQLPASLLVENPLNRYLLNSTMMDQFKRDADGGLTLYIQNEAPGPDKEANWLPAPKGPFWVVLRLYVPEAEALDGRWTQPPITAQQTPAQEGVKVTPETYIRAETDLTFVNTVKMAGGVNRWVHNRAPTPLDKQTVVRMNRDTLYSYAIVDTSKGATVTIPPLEGGRFMSVLVVDNDHYAPAVHYEPGTYDLPRDTKYLAIIVRTQVFDPKDAAEIAEINRLQDALVIEANSADPMPTMRWDLESLKVLKTQYERDASTYPSYKGMMGPRGKVDEKTRHIAAAAAWGLNPERDATYLNYNGGHDYRVCHQATFDVPENNAFWSITVYGSDAYMKRENVILNSSSAKLNDDGTFTAYFGSGKACGDVPNRLDVTEGWNFLLRIYRPGPSVLDGSYTLPTPAPVN